MVMMPSEYNSEVVHVTLSREIWMNESCPGLAVDISGYATALWAGLG